MILGFAHMAINAQSLDALEREYSLKGYSKVVRYSGVKNYIAKSIYVEHHSNLHDLTLLSGLNLCPIELTSHGEVKGVNQQLSLNDALINIYIRDPMRLHKFFTQGLGFSLQSDGILELPSTFVGSKCLVRLNYAETDPVKLDHEGATCMAFYSNKIHEDVAMLVRQGAYDCTDIFEMHLGNKRMLIVMMRIPCGVLLELINPLRN